MACAIGAHPMGRRSPAETGLASSLITDSGRRSSKSSRAPTAAWRKIADMSRDCTSTEG